MRPVGSKYLLEEPLGRGATGTVWRGQVRGEEGTARRRQGAQGRAGRRPGRRDALPARALRAAPAAPPAHRPGPRPGRRGRSARPGHGPDRRPRPAPLPAGERPLQPGRRRPADRRRRRRARRQPRRRRRPPRPEARERAAGHHRGEDGAERMHPMLTDFGIARLADSPGRHPHPRVRRHPGLRRPRVRRRAARRPPRSTSTARASCCTSWSPAGRRSAATARSRCCTTTSTTQPRRPGNVPEPLWTVIERCLRKEPAQRPSAESLARALRVVAAGVGVHATPAQAEAALAVGALLAPDEEPTLVAGTGAPAGAGPATRTPRRCCRPAVRRTTRTRPPASCPPTPGGPAPPTAPGCCRPTPGRPAGAAAGAGPAPVGVPAQRGPAPQRADRGPPGRPRERPAAPPPGPPAAAPAAAAAAAAARPAAVRRGPTRPAARPGLRLPPAGRPGAAIRLPAAATAAPPAAAAELRAGGTSRSAPAPAPHRRADTPPREPRRSANPMKIPGLGCLKGCLIVVLVARRHLRDRLVHHPAARLGEQHPQPVGRDVDLGPHGLGQGLRDHR